MCVSPGPASSDSPQALAQAQDVTGDRGLTSPSRTVTQGQCPLLPGCWGIAGGLGSGATLRSPYPQSWTQTPAWPFRT